MAIDKLNMQSPDLVDKNISKITALFPNRKQVFKAEQNFLFACFDKGVDEDFAKEIAKGKALCIDDTAKENVKQSLEQLDPDTKMKVI